MFDDYNEYTVIMNGTPGRTLRVDDMTTGATITDTVGTAFDSIDSPTDDLPSYTYYGTAFTLAAPTAAS